MGFDRFGRVSFIAQTKTSEFVDYLENGELQATRCKGCGKIYFPPRSDCCSCLGSEMGWEKVSGQGELVSFTRSYFAPTGFEEDVPYILAVADFNEVKVFGRFKEGFTEEDLFRGMKVKADPVSYPDGQVSYEFSPL